MLDNINCKSIKLNPYTLFIYFVLLFCLLFERKSNLDIFICFCCIIFIVIFYIDFKIIKKSYKFLLLVFIIPITFNLLYIKDYNNLLSTSFLITSFMLTFMYFNHFIDDEKTFHIFYRFVPKTSLVMSISLRYYHLIIKKYSQIYDCYKANNIENKSFKQKLNDVIDIFLSTTTITLEDGIILSQSIKSKSYLNKATKRTYYNTFDFTFKDIIVLFFTIISFYMYINNKNIFYLITFVLTFVLFDIIINIWRLITCHISA